MKYEEEIRELISTTNGLTEPADGIPVEKNLLYAGIDSMAFIRLIIKIEDVFGIKIPDDKIMVSKSGTIKNLCEVVAEAEKDL